jgi:hypothetical protein
VYPENGAGGARNYLNILIRQNHTEAGWPTSADNSFWLDYTYNSSPPGSIHTVLLPEIRKALDHWSGANPAKMNFYVAVQDPRNDPEAMRGFLNCANIDITVDIDDNPNSIADNGGRRTFSGFTQRLRALRPRAPAR